MASKLLKLNSSTNNKVHDFQQQSEPEKNSLNNKGQKSDNNQQIIQKEKSQERLNSQANLLFQEQKESKSQAFVKNNQQTDQYNNIYDVNYMYQYHGFDQIAEELRHCVHKTKNGWINQALIQGAEKTKDKMVSNTDTLAIMSGLLLSGSMTLILDPPEIISDLNDDDNEEFGIKAAWYFFLSASIILHLVTILIACMFSSNINNCARYSDILRMILKFAHLPGTIYMFFSFGCYSLALTALVGIIHIFSFITASISGFLFSILGAYLQYYHHYKLLPQGHVKHGWMSGKLDKFEKHIQIQKIDQFEQKAKQLNEFLDKQSNDNPLLQEQN